MPVPKYTASLPGCSESPVKLGKRRASELEDLENSYEF